MEKKGDPSGGCHGLEPVRNRACHREGAARGDPLVFSKRTALPTLDPKPESFMGLRPNFDLHLTHS